MFLALQSGYLIDGFVPRRKRLLLIHFLFVVVDVIGEVPISILVLRRQAIGVNRGVERPGVYLYQRIVLVDEGDPVAVFLQDLWKQCAVHGRTIGAFEVVEIHRNNLAIFRATGWPSLGVDLVHDFGIGIFVQIELR